MTDQFNLPAVPSILPEIQGLNEEEKKALLEKVPQDGNDLVKQALVVATDPKFVDQIDREVGNPRKNETLEEYVQRGKQAVIDALRKIFK